ncbi:MAG TPA: AI-2E family transporter [Gemmatimonadales bacterium]|nr:AI-2E family transporter [Gemmatimonadales bacterium]
MAFLDTRRQRAALLVSLLGVGLAVALAPYASGLIGGVVLYVLFGPVNARLRARLGGSVAAGIVTALAALLIILPGLSVAGLMVSKAQQIAAGVSESPLLAKVARIRIAGYAVGPQLEEFGRRLIEWVGANAFGFIGTATRAVLNITIALFGLYFLLLRPDTNWDALRPYIPFSTANSQRLRDRFRDVTASTLIGVLFVGLAQGTLLAAAFWVLGVSDAVFWGLITAIMSVIPLLGSGLIWGPAAVSLALDDRWGAAIALVIWGLVIVGSADNLIRPLVYRRWAQIHPVVTLVGALAGIRYFGLLGILIGPLALSYFFELIRMYREEYVEPSERFRRTTTEVPVVSSPRNPLPRPGVE